MPKFKVGDVIKWHKYPLVTAKITKVSKSEYSYYFLTHWYSPIPPPMIYTREFLERDTYKISSIDCSKLWKEINQ